MGELEVVQIAWGLQKKRITEIYKEECDRSGPRGVDI